MPISSDFDAALSSGSSDTFLAARQKKKKEANNHCLINETLRGLCGEWDPLVNTHTRSCCKQTFSWRFLSAGFTSWFRIFRPNASFL